MRKGKNVMVEVWGGEKEEEKKKGKNWFQSVQPLQKRTDLLSSSIWGSISRILSYTEMHNYEKECLPIL